MHRSDFMAKKKTIRKYELKQRIERLEKANSYLQGQLSSTAQDIFEEILSEVKNQVDRHIARKEFLAMTRDVSLWLWLFLKKNVSDLSFKYRDDWYVYFGTDEEFDTRSWK